jgi:aminoglycoside 3-N-acetyltransferase
MDGWLGALQREGQVGNAHARLMRSRDVVRSALEHLREDPLTFLCREGCRECARAQPCSSSGA